MRRRCSSLEVLLSVLCSVLLVCCSGLIGVSWLSLQPAGAGPALGGRMVISEGVVFSEELRNSSSLQFKSLAFDVQRLVSEAFDRSDLRDKFKSCEVSQFSKGSVVVTFDLWFHQPVDVKEVEQELGAGLQDTGAGLVIDSSSIQITDALRGGASCIPRVQLCDGVADCPDGSDEETRLCATACDGQFVLLGPSGSFRSTDFPPYNSSSFCRWVIRVQKGFSVQINFQLFETEEGSDTLSLYEGIGPDKHRVAVLSGSAPPGTVWLLSDQSTVEFSSDDYNNLSGFSATYRAANTSNLSNEEKLTCSFEQGLCFWRQQADDDGWIRTSGPTFPPFTGPTADHTLGNMSGFYIVTPPSPGQWERSFQIHSLPLTPPTQPMCLQFWYHMFGEDVHRLKVLVLGRSPPDADPPVTVVFQRDGNYGDNWNYGQVNLNLTAEETVVFEALKKGGMRSDVALDDIILTTASCGDAPPDPTTVPPPTTAPPIPPDCGGPFDLWEPNSTFSSPNYPQSYGNRANCVWTLHARRGRNIQLHFLDLDVEATYDIVEVRDGAGPDSVLLGVFTGSDSPAPDLISTANQVTVRFYSDHSGHGRGFRANFTSGFHLGSPDPCAAGQYQCGTGSCIHGNGQCDGAVDCPDGSDEADCVLQLNGSTRLQVRLHSRLFTVCAHSWSSHLSDLTCTYLGHRAGNVTLLPARPDHSPFVTVNIDRNGTMELNTSESCVGEQVMSLSCDNQPCGVRLVSMETGGTGSSETDQSAERRNGQGVRVVGGVDAGKGAWPWMVSLYWRGRHVCGASLIDSEWLVTAAHCVFGKNLHLQFWVAMFGLHSHSDSGSPDVQTRRVDQIIINRHYNRQTKQADIAMMHLQTPINFTAVVQPVCLPRDDQQFEAGRKCFIAGWGRDAEQGSPADVLQEAQVPLVSQAQCQVQLPEYNVTSSMMCAGFAEGGVDSCQGDSGGPLLCEEDTHWILTGVTSFGIGCGRPERPGVYARVSSFISWIAQTRRSSFISSSSSSSSSSS
uniref:LOW QUALITY PROTEIN: enteropeptidase-like n=1 Tax=Centroberyx gerrardi TaxID=166262 RepID=UPI003AADEEE1